MKKNVNHCLSGRLGLIICEDLLWQYPTVDLVESNNVDTIIFPTEWWDEYPHQLPHVAQASWAKALQVIISAAGGWKNKLYKLLCCEAQQTIQRIRSYSALSKYFEAKLVLYLSSLSSKRSWKVS